MPTKIALADKSLLNQQASTLTSDQVELPSIDPDSVDSEILRGALKRASERLNGEISAKHNSHHSHHSHGTAAW
jgi:hypothetical protein